MKLKITNEEDTGQSAVIQYRDTHTGGDGASGVLAPGQSAEVELNANSHIVIMDGAVHFTDGDEAPPLSAVGPVITGTAVTEKPGGEKTHDASDLVPADPDTVARITKEELDKGAATTADGKIQVSALNDALKAQGYLPVASTERDEAHAAATA